MINCWPHGHAGRPGDCDATIPDDSYATMKRYGWGFVTARDDGSETGDGPFLACPDHRDDCTEQERAKAFEANKLALAEKP